MLITSDDFSQSYKVVVVNILRLIFCGGVFIARYTQEVYVCVCLC